MMSIAEVDNLISEIGNLLMKFGRPEKQKFYLTIREQKLIVEALQGAKGVLENKLCRMKFTENFVKGMEKFANKKG